MQGQNLRLFINEKVIAGATDCTVHVAATLEDNSTKDETGGAPSQEFVGYTYDLSSDSIFAVDGSLEMLSTLSFQGQGVGPLSINGVEVGTVPPATGG